jgi:PKD repeat protein
VVEAPARSVVPTLAPGPFTITVSGLTAAPSAGNAPLTVQLSAAARSDLGVNTTFSFNWSFADGTPNVVSNVSVAVATTARDSLSHVYSSPGTYAARVNVTDNHSADPYVVSRNIVVTVAGPLQVWANATPATFTLGASTQMAPGIVGGMPPYRVVWSATPAGCVAGAVLLNCTPTTSGTYSIRLGVTDALNNRNSTNVVVVVNPSLVILAGFTSYFTCQGTVGVLQDNFSATTTGGTLPVRYTWVFGDGSAPANGSQATHNFAVSGNYSVLVWANDSGGADESYNISVSAGFPNCGAVAPPSFQPPVVLLEAATAALVVVIVILAVLVIRTGRPPTAAPPPAAADPPPSDETG